MALTHVEVRGLVQGVGFRWFAREAARRHGISGWVRNRSDGSVEIAACGDEARLSRFLDDVRRGPAGARVATVHELPTETLPPLRDPFEIVR